MIDFSRVSGPPIRLIDDWFWLAFGIPNATDREWTAHPAEAMEPDRPWLIICECGRPDVRLLPPTENIPLFEPVRTVPLYPQEFRKSDLSFFTWLAECPDCERVHIGWRMGYNDAYGLITKPTRRGY